MEGLGHFPLPVVLAIEGTLLDADPDEAFCSIKIDCRPTYQDYFSRSVELRGLRRVDVAQLLQVTRDFPAVRCSVSETLRQCFYTVHLAYGREDDDSIPF